MRVALCAGVRKQSSATGSEMAPQKLSARRRSLASPLF
jgi:hypothetical protein